MAKKILIVEDDKFLREPIVQRLLKEGYDILEAIDGEKGIEIAKEEKPDLILLDLILPGIDGFEVLSSIKKETETSSIPVVILSNLGQRNDVQKALELGAKDYIIKAHFTPGEIVLRVGELLK